MAMEPTSGPIVQRGAAAQSAVAAPDPSFATSRRNERHIVDLLGGTTRMRETQYVGEWLPKEPAESPRAYRDRLKRSFLTPLFADALDKLVSKPFSRTVEVRELDKLDRRLWGLEDDADGDGRSLSESLRALLYDAIAHGLSVKLVDYPKSEVMTRPNQETEILTRIQPTIVQIDKQQILGVRFWKVKASGRFVLTQLRYEEDVDEPAGAYGIESRRQIRVWNAPEFDDYGYPAIVEGDVSLGSVETHVLGDEGWVMTENRPHTYPGIPAVILYTERTGRWEANPPLDDLAWLNVDHWQQSSDQRHILHFGKVPFLFISGISPEKVDEVTEIGVTRVMKEENPQAKAVYVEPTGGTIKIGMEAIKELEARAEILGSAPLFERAATATEVRTNEGRTTTRIQEWLRSVENVGTTCFRMAARWLNPDVRKYPDDTLLPEGFSVDVYSDFVVADQATMDALVKARQNDDIDRKTFLQELQRLGILSPSLDVDAVSEAVEKELTESLKRGAFGVDRQDGFAGTGAFGGGGRNDFGGTGGAGGAGGADDSGGVSEGGDGG